MAAYNQDKREKAEKLRDIASHEAEKQKAIASVQAVEMEVEGEPAPVSLQLSNFRSVETHGNNDTVKKAGRVLLKCCCCNKPVKSKKLTFAGPNRVQTNHTNFQYGLDHKGVDTA